MRAVSSDGLDLYERLKGMRQQRHLSTRLMFFLKLNNLHHHQKVVLNYEIRPSGNEPQSPSDRLVSTSGPSASSKSFTSTSCPLAVTLAVLCLSSVNMWSCYPDCKVPPTPRRNKLTPFRRVRELALGETQTCPWRQMETDSEGEREMQLRKKRDGGEEEGTDVDKQCQGRGHGNIWSRIRRVRNVRSCIESEKWNWTQTRRWVGGRSREMEGGKNREIWSLMQMEREEEKWSLTGGEKPN